jgi:hypothetical protein
MAAKCATDDLLLKPVDEHAESVRAVYVVSRMIEFIEVGGGDTLAKRLQQLHMLIQRDKVQSELNYARATAMQQQTTVLRPAVQCWQKAAGRLARPAEKRRLSVANRFAALGCDLGQSDEASTESTVGSDSSSTTTRVLNCLRQTAEEGQRRKRRRPALRAMQALEKPEQGEPNQCAGSHKGAVYCKATCGWKVHTVGAGGRGHQEQWHHCAHVVARAGGCWTF